jgi:hypothetical protein
MQEPNMNPKSKAGFQDPYMDTINYRIIFSDSYVDPFMWTGLDFQIFNIVVVEFLHCSLV